MANCASCGSALKDDTKFCPNCGTAVGAAPAAATYQPTTPAPVAATAAPTAVADTSSAAVEGKFCHHCGATVAMTDLRCPTCGRYLKATSGGTPKSKTTAVVLAVFLTGWSWLYTFQRNRNKFWIYIAGVVLAIFLWILALNGAHTVQSCDSFNYCTTQIVGFKSGFAILAGLLATGFWVWAIVDNATKPTSWYQQYPNG